MAYGFSLSPLSNFRAVTLRIKGWVVSGQLGRRRDPRARLEQPPFVRGELHPREEKNISMPPVLPSKAKEMEDSKNNGSQRSRGYCDGTDNNVSCFYNVARPGFAR